MDAWVLLTFLATLTVKGIQAACPDYDITSCEFWSDSATWPNNQVPGDGEMVTIDKCVLLDISSNSLGGMLISPGGSLVFSPSFRDLTLTSKYIRVEGLLRVGSEACRFQGRAEIVLSGNPGEHVDADFGEKFIGVASGGSLELHGLKKTAWTKLNETLLKTKDLTNYFDSENSKVGEGYESGLHAVVINPSTGVIRYKGAFQIGAHEYHFKRDAPKLISMLDWVPPGHALLLASSRNAISPEHNNTLIFEALEKALYCKIGKSRLRHLQYREAYVAIAIKEQPWRSIERVGRTSGEDENRFASADMLMPLTNAAFYVSASVHPTKEWISKTRFIGGPYDINVPILDMAGDVSSWQAGDSVLVTSTDYDWEQATLGRLEKCEIHHRNVTCSSTQMRLKALRKYMHWGEITDGVDMRAEVASLTRNVVVRSIDVASGDNNFGGQIKVKEGFTSARIDGVALQHMGQDNREEAYPIFFDMAGEVNGTAYVKGSVILESYRRCVVLRATHYMEVEYNVAYSHVGTCFYLMDGGEKYNVFRGNLAVGTLQFPDSKLEDRDVSSFLITNPLTVFSNNVAAGGTGCGITYSFPPEPVGQSKGLGLMAVDEAKRTPFLEFVNNVAHSNQYTGLDLASGINAAGTDFYWNTGFYFKSNPLDKDSEDVPSYVTRGTMYKNRFDNVAARGGWLVFDRMSLSDSIKGIQISWSSNQSPRITNSVILGESPNIGEPTMYWNQTYIVPFPRSLPHYWDPTAPIQGVALNDGPIFVDNIFFNHFNATEHHTSGALGFLRNNRWWTSPLNAVSNAKFGFDDGTLTGNRVFDGVDGIPGFSDLTGDIQALFRDLDGSVTGYADTAVVKPFPFFYTDSCFYKENWMLHVCPHRYGKLTLGAQGGTFRTQTTPFMTRDDIPTDTFDQVWTTTANFPVILGEGYSYILHFDNKLPSELWITGDGFEKDLSVRFGVCLPMNAEFELYTYVPSWKPKKADWNEVASIEDLEATDVATSYFFDAEVGVVFFKLINDHERDPGEMQQCPLGLCPRVRLTISSGDLTDSDCTSRAYPKYTRTATARKRSATALTEMALPATSQKVPSGLGAGSTYPFAGIEVGSGAGYLDWSEWSACSQSCGGGVTSRERVCNDASGCVGDSYEEKVCNDNKCPIDGGFGDWGEWTDCSKTCGGGERSRTRLCNQPTPQHGGADCDGSTIELEECNSDTCPIDGGYSDWGEWGECSVTCGGGQKTRSRLCNDPEPQNGGAECEGSATDTEDCNSDVCPVNGGYGDWAEWSECSVTCGDGQRIRERECDSPAPSAGGTNCDGPSSETEVCSLAQCQHDSVCPTGPTP